MPNFCGQCGQAVTSNNRFCPNCGAPASASAAPPASAPPSSAPAPAIAVAGARPGGKPWKWVVIPLVALGALFVGMVLVSAAWVAVEAGRESPETAKPGNAATANASAWTPGQRPGIDNLPADLPDDVRRQVAAAFAEGGMDDIDDGALEGPIPGTEAEPPTAAGWRAGASGTIPTAGEEPRRGRPLPPPAPAQTETVGANELRVARLFDPMMRNQEAFRVIVPSGWKTEGRLEWTLQSVGTPATMWMRHTRDDGKADVIYTSKYSFWSDPPLGQLGVNYHGYLYGYKVMDRMTPEAYFQWYFANHPQFGVTNIQVQQVTPHPVQRHVDAMIARAPASPIKPTITLRTVTGQCHYQGRIRRFRAYAGVTIKPMPNQARSALWDGSFDVLFAEPAALASAEADFDGLFISGQPNQHWKQLIQSFTDQMNAIMAKRQSEGWALAAKIREDCSRRVDEIIRANQPRYSATDKAAHAWSQYIRDVDSYALPDGGTVEIPTKYDSAFLGPNGRIVMGSRGMSPGSGYTELRKTGPFE